MNLSKATNHQLKVIMNYDRHCPSELLTLVIHEMLQRGILKDFVMYHAKRYFGSVRRREIKLGLEDSDMIQLGYIGIWKALEKYEEGKSSFSTFSQYYIRTEWGNHTRRFNSLKRTGERDYVSTDLEVNEEGNTVQDFIPSYENVEKTVLMKIYFEEQLKLLTPLQRAAVIGYIEGYDMRTIAEREQANKRSADRAFRTAMKKLGIEDFSLRENCGLKGA
jgi:RNA polymerase sigma factor (sigma-70 family)